MFALLEPYLHRSGYDLITSGDGFEAVAKMLNCDPGLVILDGNVPRVSGENAAKMLRDRGCEKPIIALTASELSAGQQRASPVFCRKPVPMKALFAEAKRLTY